MADAGPYIQSASALERPVTVDATPYISAEYARAEQDRLWRRTWLQAGRVEDIPEAGNFITYDILDDSVLIVRTDEGAIRAFWNVCSHRGRKLVDVPAGRRNARGDAMRFVCGFHSWTYDLEGRCTHIPKREHWDGLLTEERTRLGPVRCETWGGWVWINLDSAAEPLREYLEPAATLLDPYQLENMRCRWRRWIVFDCNWKVAMEAFDETYHVPGTHPELGAFADFSGWSRNQGLHINIGYDAPKGMDENQGKLRIGTVGDARLSTAELQRYTWDAANTNTTRTMVEASYRLKDELPEGTPPTEVLAHWLKRSRMDDEARGVFWPIVPSSHAAQGGTAWQIFPNFQIGHAVNNMLCYQARPYGDDPGKCIFEGAVYELYPEGEAPETEWEYTQAEDWPAVLKQDFANMSAVQRGLRSGGFRGTLPNPYMERAVGSLHMNLAKYVGTDGPRVLEPDAG